MLTEERLRARLHREIESVRLSPEFRDRLDARLRAPTGSRIRILALATAAVMLVLVGIAASIIAGGNGERPATPAASVPSASPSDFSILPTPSHVRITPPARDVPRELAAYSGTWQGLWDGQLASRLIVESIDRSTAHVVYVWGYIPNGLGPGWERVTARVRPGGMIEFGRDPRTSDRSACTGRNRPLFCTRVWFSFTMRSTYQAISGLREVGSGSQGYANYVLMRRVESSSHRIDWIIGSGVFALAVASLGLWRKARSSRAVRHRSHK